MLAGGADVNGTNDGGQTALMLAALMGRSRVVPLLLEAGADPRLQDQHGLTALEWSRRRGFLEVTQLLASAQPPSGSPASESTSDSVDAGTRTKSNLPITSESKPEGLKPGKLGPATKAALRAWQARRELEAASAEPPEAQVDRSHQSESPLDLIVATESEPLELPRASEPGTEFEPLSLMSRSEISTEAGASESALATDAMLSVGPEPPSEPSVAATGSEELREPDTVTVETSSAQSEPGTAPGPQPGDPAEVATRSEPEPIDPIVTFLEQWRTDPLEIPQVPEASPQEPQTPEPERVSAGVLNHFEEEVSRKAEDETWPWASYSAEIPEDTKPKATSSTSPAESDISEPITERSPREPATNERVPAFQKLSLGLSAPTTSSDVTQISNLKRCPKCDKIYENTLLLYCTRDTTRLISIGNPQFDPAPSHSSARLLVWPLIAVVLGGSAFAAYRLNQYFFEEQAPSPVAATRVEPAAPEIKKPSFTVSGKLAGLEINVPEPEYPVAAQSAGISGLVMVRIQVNKKGKVVSARSLSGDWRLRTAAVNAARQATFSPEKLAQVSPRSRVVSGSIMYEFAPASTVTATSSPATTAAQTGTTASTETVDAPALGTELRGSETNADPKSPLVGGPLVGAAINLPAAEYPSRARRAGVAGAITVTVRVNRAGRVISWRSSPGDSQLRAAALKAAKKATFSREKLPGTGEVVGTITYNFIP